MILNINYTLKEEWNGLKTCRECYEPKHPQLTPHSTGRSSNYYKPRPDTDKSWKVFLFIINIIGSLWVIEWTNLVLAVSGDVDTTPTPTYTSPTCHHPNIYCYGSLFRIQLFLYRCSRAPNLTLTEGNTYRFDQSDSTNATHPLRISTTSDGSHGGGTEYTTGVTKVGTAGSSGAYTEILVASGAPTLYYYCSNHSGMGGILYTT